MGRFDFAAIGNIVNGTPPPDDRPLLSPEMEAALRQQFDQIDYCDNHGIQLHQVTAYLRESMDFIGFDKATEGDASLQDELAYFALYIYIEKEVHREREVDIFRRVIASMDSVRMMNVATMLIKSMAGRDLDDPETIYKQLRPMANQRIAQLQGGQ